MGRVSVLLGHSGSKTSKAVRRNFEKVNSEGDLGNTRRRAEAGIIYPELGKICSDDRNALHLLHQSCEGFQAPSTRFARAMTISQQFGHKQPHARRTANTRSNTTILLFYLSK
jgi:hypothetical protein